MYLLFFLLWCPSSWQMCWKCLIYLEIGYECCLCSFFICLFIFMFLFFQNSANYNDGVENNTNNENSICHGTDDSQSSSEYEFDISDDGSDVQSQPQHRSMLGRGLVRIRGGRFRRCGRVGRGSSTHAVPRVANQPVKWSILLILKILTLANCFMKRKGQIDFCYRRPRLIVCICFFLTKNPNRLYNKVIITMSNRVIMLLMIDGKIL